MLVFEKARNVLGHYTTLKVIITLIVIIEVICASGVIQRKRESKEHIMKNDYKHNKNTFGIKR